MAYLLVLFPLLMAAAAFAAPSNRWRPWLLPAGALVQLVFVMVAIFQPSDRGPVSGLSDWLLLDPLGKVILGFRDRTVLSVRAVCARLSGAAC